MNITEYRQAFSERLKMSLGDNFLKQKQLADISGFSLSEINHWCSGRRLPTLQHFAELTKYLPKTSLTFLVSGKSYNPHE
jgi:transcriptional regulator with XRE-family HTH domain